MFSTVQTDDLELFLKCSQDSSNQTFTILFSIKRFGLICVAFFVLYTYQWLKTEHLYSPFVTTNDEILNVPFVKQVPCSDDYKVDREQFPNCAPKICGRLVIDDLISERETEILLSLFKKALLLNPLSANQSASILGKSV